MTKKCILPLFLCFQALLGFAQADTATKPNLPNIFERITTGVKEFRLDTSAAPNDKITRKIQQLRSLRGGFNINEVIEFKIAEDRQKNESSAAELDRLARFFQSGNGKRWLDNAVIWLYRKEFTYKELKQLVRFYRTSAGQKMATDFPILMMQSLRAAEMIKELYANEVKNGSSF